METHPSVRITKLCRSAVIHYVEEGGSYDFDAELGGGDVLLSIYAPRDDGEWAQKLPWAAGRRREVLEEIARQVVRMESSGSSFIDHRGRVDILTESTSQLTDAPWIRPLLLAAIVYGVVGLEASRLAGAASSPQVRSAWRLTGWLVSLATFTGHIAFEHLQLRAPLGKLAAHAAAAVAFGALALAIVGPVRAHGGASDASRTFALSLVLWPIISGIPAYLSALALGWILELVDRG